MKREVNLQQPWLKWAGYGGDAMAATLIVFRKRACSHMKQKISTLICVPAGRGLIPQATQGYMHAGGKGLAPSCRSAN
jgi:hypothetical protein